MNEKIKQHLINYCKEKGWGITNNDLWETLIECGKEVYEKKIDSRRWWDEYFHVTELNGILIGYYNAHTTGDDSPEDKGWEKDLTSVCEVEKTEKIIFIYKPKK